MYEARNIFDKHFAVIEDTRCQCDVKYPLIDVLILITCAILCNQVEVDDIVDYGEGKIEFLNKYFGIKKIPSSSTITRILNMINAVVMSVCIVNVMREMFGISGDIIAIDGKTICSTAKMKSYKEKVHIMTAYMTDNGISLGQISVSEKTNEIPCMIDLLDLIDVKEKIITADAMHCQKETVKAIRAKKCDYVLGVKKNQPTLHNDIELMVNDLIKSTVKSDKEKYETAYTAEKNRTRYEKRTCYVIRDTSWLEQKKDWTDLNNIIAIERIVEESGNRSQEMSYYISSLDSTPEEYLHIVREHWKIESMHWFLDVVMKEDECRILSQNGLKNLNVLKKLALSMHKNYIGTQKRKISMKRNMHRCLLNDELLVQVIKNPV